ncbi:Trappc4 protein [Metarhizium acridum CQMa 102]|uniref:Trafficking protein particle complex subunit n=1 Tax=Metarhizium acridum (strain CQMa 102) TaxID=655827 RepID=E9E5Y9_METAQ|nr:Trappc4 protein [Metarhizium acridum CQMa 102]EFY88669.1 Trappc4 protein [Metarhizium acridum CQMa 102]
MVELGLRNENRRTVFALIIINKAGGLVYNKTFHDGGLHKISTNDYLVLAGTFHGFVSHILISANALISPPWRESLEGFAAHIHSVHAITARLNPIKPITPHPGTNGVAIRPEPSSGLEVLETENFRLQCFNTMTGTKFLLFTDSTQANVDVTIRRIYDLYSDYRSVKEWCVPSPPLQRFHNPALLLVRVAKVQS